MNGDEETADDFYDSAMLTRAQRPMCRRPAVPLSLTTLPLFLQFFILSQMRAGIE